MRITVSQSYRASMKYVFIKVDNISVLNILERLHRFNYMYNIVLLIRKLFVAHSVQRSDSTSSIPIDRDLFMSKFYLRH